MDVGHELKILESTTLSKKTVLSVKLIVCSDWSVCRTGIVVVAAHILHLRIKLG